MVSLENLMHQLVELNQNKIQITEAFHQINGAICVIEGLIKTHYPHPEEPTCEGEAQDEQVNCETKEQVTEV